MVNLKYYKDRAVSKKDGMFQNPYKRKDKNA